MGLNIVGFTLYGCYNIALFWIDSVQEEYQDKHPQGVIPVKANDVFFPIHAVFASAVTIVQCCIYERAGQTVSRVCLGLLAAIFLFVGITLIKYCPQAYMNYRRKSTVGWSIGNILLDFT